MQIVPEGGQVLKGQGRKRVSYVIVKHLKVP